MPRSPSDSFASRGRLLLPLVVATAIVFGIQPANADDPSDRLDAAREAVDDVAQQYFDTQAALFALDQEIELLEDEIAIIESEADDLRRVATERAVEVYKSNDASIDQVLADDALDAARRIELIDRANARNDDAFRALDLATDELDQRRDALEERRDDQADTLAALDTRQTELRELLDAARDAYLAAEEVEASTSTALELATRADSPDAPTSGVPSTDTTAPVADPPPPPPAPRGTHPQHDDPFLVCTRQRESRGDYTVVSPAGYYGAYQFAPTTWDTTASHAGRPELIGVPPNTASEYDQDDMAWTLYQWQGKQPWGNRC
ncbi:MAG TPA: transglycosylase family protein [Acidimicrobiia bacterium]|nr:transglycosylase family protein [Acidimicrobiia bacterium]